MGKPMLELQIERIRQSRLIDRVIVSTSERHQDDALEELSDRLGCLCFRGSEEDVLGRVVGALKKYEVDIHVEFQGYNPLPDALRALEGRKLHNPNIPRMIHAYFEDMHGVVDELARVCRRGAHVALLVGNVQFGGEPIPVDLILGEMAEARGFSVRTIEVTRTKGNASQQMGRYGRTPSRESLSNWVRN